jgi:HlyD family secretion protein
MHNVKFKVNEGKDLNAEVTEAVQRSQSSHSVSSSVISQCFLCVLCVRSFSSAALGILLASCLVGWSCSGKGEAEKGPTVMVQVAVAEKTAIQRKVSADAVLYPLSQSAMVPKISAPVSKYYVDRGSHVHAGQLLAVLENQDLIAAAAENKGAYEQALAAYETATKGTLPEGVKKAEGDFNSAKEALDAQQKLYESRQTLFKQGAISRKEVDDSSVTYAQARATYEQAKQHLESVQSVSRHQDLKAAAGQLGSAKGKYEGAQAQLSYSELRSPIDGVVTDRSLYPGEMAAAGSPIVTVMDLSQVIARAHISPSEAALVRVGDTATISAPGVSGDVPAKVTIVSPALDPTSTTVEVWVQAANRGERLKPGTSVRVTIVAQTVNDAVVVPAAALLTDTDGTTSVIVANGDKPEQRPVKTGIRDGSKLQITEGLSGGEKVVTVGAFELSREDPDVLKKTTIQIQAPKTEGDEKGGGKEADKGQ